MELACKKAKIEGAKILKKYKDLDFYLANLAFGNKTEFIKKSMAKQTG